MQHCRQSHTITLQDPLYKIVMKHCYNIRKYIRFYIMENIPYLAAVVRMRRNAFKWYPQACFEVQPHPALRPPDVARLPLRHGTYRTLQNCNKTGLKGLYVDSSFYCKHHKFSTEICQETIHTKHFTHHQIHHLACAAGISATNNA